MDVVYQKNVVNKRNNLLDLLDINVKYTLFSLILKKSVIFFD